jgi:hypothetical protein
MKINVHNLNEVKALIKEAFANGTEGEYQDATWFTHKDELICKSKINFTEFELILSKEDGGGSLTIEM